MADTNEDPKVYNSELDAFDLYHQLQEQPAKTIPYLTGPDLPSVGHAIAGAIGSAISNVCTYPLALVITRLQTRRQSKRGASTDGRHERDSILDVVSRIYHDQGGLQGFTPGIGPDTAKTVTDAFIFFLAYDSIRRSRLHARGAAPSCRLPVLDELIIGFISGSLCKFVTTPLATIVTRRQTATPSSEVCRVKSDSFKAIASDIWKEKGISGFWSGYSASLILTLNPSLTFLFFERLKYALIPRDRRSHLSSRETFFLAALSKALASSVTYPFSLAKSRMQSNSTESSGTTGEKGTTSASSKTLARTNVITTVSAIAQSEGIGALYQGLSGEVLKGFFSHGITMLVKGIVHRVVVRLFYTILRLLRKYPDPTRLAQAAGKRIEQVASEVSRKVATT